MSESKIRIWLDKNESPFDLPSDLKEELFNELKKLSLNRYPSKHANSLRQKIAEFYGLSKENIIVGNGSDELLIYLMRAFKGKYILISSPTFDMYEKIAKILGIKVLDIPLDNNFEIDRNLLCKYAKNAITTFICSPNNPTGNLQRKDKIIDVLEQKGIVVVDEAYVEFSKQSVLDLLTCYDNLIILRTFSKAFGLAGIRVGYLLVNEQILNILLKIKLPYNLNVLSAKIAEFMLENYDIIEKTIKYIVSERKRVYRALKRYAYPSEANFLLINLNSYEYLLNKGIAVRKLGGKLKNMVRVTIGRKEENDEVIKALKEFAKCEMGSV